MIIIEDEPLIAFGLQEVLVDAGFVVAAVEFKFEKALSVIEAGGCDAAVVDANLGGVSAKPLGDALSARGLPFVVLSGYSPEQIQADFPNALCLKKPCRPAQLVKAMRSILKQ